MNRVNGRANSNTGLNIGFFEEQLYDAQRSLFLVRSVREAKFLSNRINFLRQQIKLNGGKK